MYGLRFDIYLKICFILASTTFHFIDRKKNDSYLAQGAYPFSLLTVKCT